MKKFFVLALAALMLLSLWACGKKEDEYKSSTDAAEPEAQLMPDEAGKLTIYGEADIQLVYNKGGNIIAVTALNQQADSIVTVYDFAEKTCTQAVLELIDQILDSELPLTKGFFLVRQEPGSTTPSDDFLKNIREDAQLNKGEYPVIVTGAEQLDGEGLFDDETALAVLKASQPVVEGSSMLCTKDPVGGSYTIVCNYTDGNSTQYSVGAVDGSVVLIENPSEAEPEDTTQEEEIPESDIFDPTPDTEANKGTDGGVEGGSVELS